MIYTGRTLVIDMKTGEVIRAPGTGEVQQHPTWSPDGSEIAFSALVEGRFRLYTFPSSGGEAREIPATSDLPTHARSPSWGGEGIVFVSQSLDGTVADLMVTDGTIITPLTTHEAIDKMAAVSPDGKKVAFVSERTGDEEIWVIPIEGGDAIRLTFESGEDLYPAWSPDGKRLAYSTERGGQRFLAVIDAAGGEPVVFHGNGGQPSWSRDGKTILLSKMPPSPPTYNGNPTRVADWNRRALFPNHEAFELFRVRAPLPLEVATSVALPPLESRRERNRRIFDDVAATQRRLYYRDGNRSKSWDDTVAGMSHTAEMAVDDEELEVIVDRLVSERPTIRNEARSPHGVVASAHPLATEVGLDVLRRGGNVVDAAIAVSFMLGVVEPDASGIGGDGMMLIHLVDREKTVAIDFKDQAPMRATRDNPALFDKGRSKTHGPAAVNIPGPVAGMDLAYRKYGSGRIEWKDLVLPASRAAAEGVEVTPGLASSMERGKTFLEKYPEAARIYLPDGKPIQAGDILVNSDYAHTLRTIAEEGADAFYRGSVAKAIAKDMRANGGIITFEDLAQYRAIEREPLSGHYRGYQIKTAPPPVSAGSSLIQMLQILDHYPLSPKAHYRMDTDSFHFMVEAWKRISRVRLVADPFVWDVDLSDVLSRDWAAERFESIDPDRAWPGPALPEDPSQLESYRKERISTGTTAAVVADSKGNMVALTQTLSTWGGAFYVSEGLGFLYNNHLRGFRSRPGQFGSLTPLARSSTGICPTLIFKSEGDKNVPYIAIGAAGNAWITASIYELLAGIIDFGLSPQEAIESPRFLVNRKRFPSDRPPIPGRVQYEQGIEGRVVREMRARGHRLEPIGMKGELVMGYAAVAVVDLANGEVVAGADPRRSHQALGLR
jgi:gamma-glutamyltranspeptidase